MRATSDRRTTSPLAPVFSTMSPNSCAVRRRPCALIADQEIAAARASVRRRAGRPRPGCSAPARRAPRRPRSCRAKRSCPDRARCASRSRRRRTAAHLADAGNARELVLDRDIGVVAQVKRIILAVGEISVHQHQEGRRLLLRGHARLAHFRRAGATAPGRRGSARRTCGLVRIGAGARR